MYIFLSILTILISIVLVLVVLVQNSKGGGLSSNFSSSNQIMGAPKTADFLEKLTWGLACTIIVLSLISAKIVHNANQAPQDTVATPVENTATPDVQSPLPAPTEGQTPSLPEPTK